MSLPKTIGILALALFGIIGMTKLFKSEKAEPSVMMSEPAPVVAVEEQPAPVLVQAGEELPSANRMGEFFNTHHPKSPLVETVTYSAKVDWKPGKAAWVADYASHYHTSRHMIARSLNGKADYDSQQVSNGDRFNVFKEGIDLNFDLVVDLSRCKMWVYYTHEGERTLVQTYDVGLGRSEEGRPSGSLTPMGVYTLGEKVAVYRPGKQGLYNKEPIEMLTVFGTRWIPFDEELEECTAPAKGLGLHGCPWVKQGDDWVEDISGIGGYTSDGCIRLKTEDIEELFAVIITHPTKIHLVDDFHNARLS